MKSYRKLVIGYIVLMALLLAVMISLFAFIRPESLTPANYSDEELQIYKDVWNGINASLRAGELQRITRLVIVWLILFITGLVFLLVIWLRELRPLRELRDLAQEIAKGNLDVALPMRKGVYYGDFTESFDLMREELRRS